MTLFAILSIVVALLAWVRLAPSTPARWHQPPRISADKDFRSGAARLVETGPDGLARLDAIAMATPRTTRLAGSVEEGMVTWITRTPVIGFPDYTTAQQDGGRLKILARQRFGKSDLGVNRARVDRWIAVLKGG
jgi:uncharacterized protein DUF1499